MKSSYGAACKFAWIPKAPNGPPAPPAGVGDRVELRAVAECCDDRIQAYVVALDGRPWDDGVLHLTLNHVETARSREANELVMNAERTPVSVELCGTLEWVDD